MTMSDVFDAVDPTPGYRYDSERGTWVVDRPAAIPSAQLEPELRWTPEPVAVAVAETSDMCGGCADGDHVNPYAVGSIFHTSWGYDQTNVEFYTVVRETKASVWLVPMGTEVRDGRLHPTGPVLWTTGDLCDACGGKGYVWSTVDDTYHSYREDCAACGGVSIVNPSMHRKGKHGVYVRMDSVRDAYPYNGGGCYDTYAAGGAGH